MSDQVSEGMTGYQSVCHLIWKDKWVNEWVSQQVKVLLNESDDRSFGQLTSWQAACRQWPSVGCQRPGQKRGCTSKLCQKCVDKQNENIIVLYSHIATIINSEKVLKVITILVCKRHMSAYFISFKILLLKIFCTRGYRSLSHTTPLRVGLLLSSEQ